MCSDSRAAINQKTNGLQRGGTIRSVEVDGIVLLLSYTPLHYHCAEGGGCSAKRGSCVPPTFHSRSIFGTTTDNEGQDERNVRLGKTLLEQLLAWSVVVCYGL